MQHLFIPGKPVTGARGVDQIFGIDPRIAFLSFVVDLMLFGGEVATPRRDRAWLHCLPGTNALVWGRCGIRADQGLDSRPADGDSNPAAGGPVCAGGHPRSRSQPAQGMGRARRKPARLIAWRAETGT